MNGNDVLVEFLNGLKVPERRLLMQAIALMKPEEKAVLIVGLKRWKNQA